MSKNDLAIGIDLGTTYCCVGVFRQNTVEIIPNMQGNRTTPSYVAFTENERLVGEGAKNQASANPKNTIFDAKRLIGRKFTDLCVQNDMKLWPFKVVAGPESKPRIETSFGDDSKMFYPEQISALILARLKADAESHLGQPVTKAVITVPAYFDDSQRQATKDAGAIAGLEVLRILNEPTAGALAYGLNDSKNKTKEQTILVYDLGGGTFDVSVLTIDNGVFEVLAVGGDTHCGGEDVDNLLVKFFADEFKRKNKFDITKNDRALRRLRTACEKAKRQLSTSTTATVNVDALHEGVDFNSSITRAKFEDLCRDFFSRCMAPLDKVLSDAKKSKDQINEVILIGGSTRIPKIQELVKEYFRGKEPNRSINPDEAVAYGAAIQAAILSGQGSEQTKDIVLIDVTPLSLGIETAGGIMTNIIDRNSSVPCTRTKTFSTYADNQPGVMIQVFEGERKFTKDNNKLGNFDLTGIPPAPRGVPQVEVTFNLDTNGILSVTALDKGSNKSKNITVKNDKGRLSPQEIERLISEAAKFATEDSQKAEVIEAKNSLESYLYNVKNSLSEKKVIESLGKDKSAVDDCLSDAFTWLDQNGSETAETYREKLKEVQQLLTPLMSKVHAGSTGRNGGGEPNEPSVEEMD